jgi:hypothetical protein
MSTARILAIVGGLLLLAAIATMPDITLAGKFALAGSLVIVAAFIEVI